MKTWSREKYKSYSAVLFCKIHLSRRFRCFRCIHGTPLVIETLQKLVRSLKLLGVSPLVTGIRTELSKSFVESGVRLDEIPIYANLKQAIDYLSY
jgi:hypothetical protein